MAETGNQTLAAERAKVSRSWVSLHRSTDPAFRAELEAAVRAAKARLDQAAGVEPARGWRGQGGEELVVRGSRARWTQVARARLKQWTPRAEARFLHSLAGSCNVRAACAEVGLTQASAYGHRRRWPEFARAWDAAIEEGYGQLSIALADSLGAMLGEPTAPAVPELGPMTIDQAIQAMRLHWRTAHGLPRKLGRVTKEPSMDEVRTLVLKKIAIIQRAEERRRRSTQES